MVKFRCNSNCNCQSYTKHCNEGRVGSNNSQFSNFWTFLGKLPDILWANFWQNCLIFLIEFEPIFGKIWILVEWQEFCKCHKFAIIKTINLALVIVFLQWIQFQEDVSGLLVGGSDFFWKYALQIALSSRWVWWNLLKVYSRISCCLNIAGMSAWLFVFKSVTCCSPVGWFDCLFLPADWAFRLQL